MRERVQEVLLPFLAVLLLTALIPVSVLAQDADGVPVEDEVPVEEDCVVGVGMAYDHEDEIGPATIEYLYEDFNFGIIDDGDVILEYRGYPVYSGAELHQVILDLPDVAVGEPVDMLVIKGDGSLLAVQPIAAPIVAPQEKEHTFPDRECDVGKGCKCSKVDVGSTCIRTVTIERDANCKIVKTSAECVDGTHICPRPPKKKKKGK